MRYLVSANNGGGDMALCDDQAAARKVGREYVRRGFAPLVYFADDKTGAVIGYSAKDTAAVNKVK